MQKPRAATGKAWEIWNFYPLCDFVSQIALRLPTAPPPAFRWKSSTLWPRRTVKCPDCTDYIIFLDPKLTNWSGESWSSPKIRLAWKLWRCLKAYWLGSCSQRPLLSRLVRICHSAHELIAKGWSGDGIKPGSQRRQKCLVSSLMLRSWEAIVCNTQIEKWKLLLSKNEDRRPFAMAQRIFFGKSGVPKYPDVSGIVIGSEFLHIPLNHQSSWWNVVPRMHQEDFGSCNWEYQPRVFHSKSHQGEFGHLQFMADSSQAILDRIQEHIGYITYKV